MPSSDYAENVDLNVTREASTEHEADAAAGENRPEFFDLFASEVLSASTQTDDPAVVHVRPVAARSVSWHYHFPGAAPQRGRRDGRARGDG